ncbi:MAG: nucleotidyltransferase domain-containing protein [Candidatus Magnetomorum sp.]|nr:nucleotidyltransferase domain-containing protein [Candidatus Magnetomorum sp.]
MYIKMNNNLSKIISKFTREANYILKDNVIEKYLFGSYARNRFSSESDIDILIIINNYNIDFQYKLSELASDYSIEYGVCISPILKDFELWEKNKQYNTLFYQEVAKDGIRL